MGQVKKVVNNLTFTPLQQFVFGELAKQRDLTKRFYFTGGTALSAVYLHHRESEDLDFFSEGDFSNIVVEQFVEKIAKEKNFSSRFTQIEKTRIFELVQSGKSVIKVDFGFYPYKRLKEGLEIQGIEVDSLLDIATNKLQTIISRSEVKDFVDLYFLLKKFTIWDLIYAVEKKFNLEIDLVLLSADLLKVESFNNLPNMLVPFDLKKMQGFYIKLAKKLGISVVKM